MYERLRYSIANYLLLKVWIMYWMVLLNMYSITCLYCIWLNEISYYHILFGIYINEWNYLLFILVVLLSSSSIVISVGYSDINLTIYLTLFSIIMLFFVLSLSFLSLIIAWEWLGIISYGLINYWSSKLGNGLKALMYNKLGDCSLMFILVLSYYSVGYVNFSLFIPLFIILLVLVFICISNFGYSLSLFVILLVIYFSKSAQLLFSNWLLAAMSAPTPVSSLLHSSTMVIAGVLITIYLNLIHCILLNHLFIYSTSYLILIISSILYSALKALVVSNIKSIIALSTINHLSIMFIALLSPDIMLVIFHIISHSFFKFTFFILAGSSIHSCFNYQSIYKQKSSNYFIVHVYLIVSLILSFSMSKESIIINIISLLSSPYLTFILILSSSLSILYSFKLYSFLS